MLDTQGILAVINAGDWSKQQELEWKINGTFAFINDRTIVMSVIVALLLMKVSIICASRSFTGCASVSAEM